MRYLELFLKTEIIVGNARNAFGTMLQQQSALPVPMLRQVSLQGSKIIKDQCVFEVFHCLGLSRSVLRL